MVSQSVRGEDAAPRSHTSFRASWGANLPRLAAVVGPVVLVALVALYFARHVRGLPDFDYWAIFGSLLGPGGFEVTLRTLYHTSNEHIVALTKLFYLANFAVTRGDNFGLSTIACGFSFVVACLFAAVLSRHAMGWLERMLLSLVAAIAVYTPLAAHNYLIGMSGIAWLGANCFTVCALALQMRGEVRSSLMLLGGALLLALLAGQMYSTGVVAPLALAAQALLLPRIRRIGIVLLVAGLAQLLVVFLFQRVPGGHAERTTDLLQLVTFGLTFIGAGLTTSHVLALIWGAAGVVALGALAWQWLLRTPEVDRAAGAFWLGLAAYVLMNGALAAVGRAGMGGDNAAMASRYASLPSLFWMSLLGLVLVLRAQPRSAGRFGTMVGAATFMAVVACGTVVAQGHERVNTLVQRAEGKRLAASALRLGVRDDAVMNAHVTPVPAQVYDKIPALRAIGHVPFDDKACPELGSTLEIKSSTDVLGHIDSAEPVRDGWYRVRGWALSQRSHSPPLVVDHWPFASLSCLALVGPDGVVVGTATGGDTRPDVARVYARDRVEFGWSGYARIGGEAAQRGPLYAAIPGTDHTWIRLPNALQAN